MISSVGSSQMAMLQQSSESSSSNSLSSTQLETISSVLENYDTDNLSQSDAQSIIAAFEDAGIEPSAELASAPPSPQATRSTMRSTLRPLLSTATCDGGRFPCKHTFAWFHPPKTGTSFGNVLAHAANDTLPRCARISSCSADPAAPGDACCPQITKHKPQIVIRSCTDAHIVIVLLSVLHPREGSCNASSTP